MKTSNFAILPATVRYDKRLSGAAILVYAEITATANIYGICEETNASLSRSLGLNYRTVGKAIHELTAYDHIIRLEGQYDRKGLRIVSKLLEPPPDLVEIPKEELPQDVIEYCNKILSLWESKLGITLEKKEMYIPMVIARLIKYSKDELLSSVNNRINYVTKISEWHMDAVNRVHQADISILLRDDESVFKYLNLKTEEDETKQLKAFVK